MADLVSILIPVHNARPWLERALESALDQTWPNKEVIALDDASTDGSREVLQAWRDRIRVEFAETNAGQNVSRNRLTAMSRGEWLFYLDADDELAADNVEQKIRYATDAEVIYGSMETVTFSDKHPVRSEKRVAVDYADPIAAAFWWAFPNTSSVAFKRSAVLAAGGWDERVKNCTDYALYFPLLLRGARFRAAPEAWTTYRMWSESQAVNLAPVRKMTTRLRVMLSAAEGFRQAGLWNADREQAFLDASLGAARLLYVQDPTEAVAAHRELRALYPRYSPSLSAFSRGYLAVYHSLGFATSEWLAAALRRRMPASYTRRKNPCVAPLAVVSRREPDGPSDDRHLQRQTLPKQPKFGSEVE